MNRILLACTALLVGTACSRKPADVMDSDNGTQPIAKTTRCTVPNADGVRCDVKTCKADAQSDCSTFEIGCTTYNHTYTGNNDAGTCTRGPIVGRNVIDPDRFASVRLQSTQLSLRGRAKTPAATPAG
jgi:hypothetical protein